MIAYGPQYSILLLKIFVQLVPLHNDLLRPSTATPSPLLRRLTLPTHWILSLNIYASSLLYLRRIPSILCLSNVPGTMQLSWLMERHLLAVKSILSPLLSKLSSIPSFRRTSPLVGFVLRSLPWPLRFFSLKKRMALCNLFRTTGPSM